MCQFNALREHLLLSEIRKALRDLPIGLDATYDRIFQSLMPAVRKRVSNILKWLIFSMRPLSKEELAEVFILDHDRKPPFNEDDRLKPEIVLSYLPNLVTIVKKKVYGYEENEVRLAHFSIKEYLISPRTAQGSAKYFSTMDTKAHLHISEACLAYHLHLSATILVHEERYWGSPLWEYAGKYWIDHLEQVPRASWTPFATEMALQVLTPKSQNLLNMIRICDPSYDPEKASSRNEVWDIEMSDLATPLYYVAARGAHQLIELLLDRKANIDELSPGKHNDFALAAAASNKEVSTVKLLLDRGADVKLQGGYYGSALQAAAYNEDQSIIKLLLDRGADVNVKGGRFGSALQAAAFRCTKSTVQLLIDRGADVNVQGGRYGSALMAATYFGREEIIQLLLDASADINAKTGISYGSALYTAIGEGEIDCAELLISRGAEVWPPGPELEREFQRIEDIESEYGIISVRAFQEDPNGYIAVEKAFVQAKIQENPLFESEIESETD